MRYLTKSRFKLGLNCPTKLYYTGKKQFPDQNANDPFLEQLANGGFQVEALARLMYEGGTMIDSWNRDEASAQTFDLLDGKDAILYEASFLNNGLHVRTDIVEKRGDYLKLIEVKAKSSQKSKPVHEEFLNSKGDKLNSGWEAYLWDIAFQTYVAKLVFPNLKTGSFLLLADKDAKASKDGIHQKFKITQEGNDKRSNIKVEPGLRYEDLGESLLVEKDVSEIVLRIINGEFVHSNGNSFSQNVKMLFENYSKDIEMRALIGRQCKGCEFRLNDEQKQNHDFISGFERCWINDGRVKASELELPKTYDIYYSSFSRKVMDETGVLLAKDLNESHLNNPNNDTSKYSRFDRQAMQLEDIKSDQIRSELHEESFSNYLSRVKYPLNMIDFETSSVAIPFTKNLSPYETIAFQFSHHMVYEDGRVEHANQWLMTDPNTFPNFEFVRALKAAVESNDGSIFRYHNHENTVLNHIKRQLVASSEKDRVDLIQFIETITSYESEEGGKIYGDRCMIDLHRVINDSYYNTHFAHSLSLKVVLPAVIEMDDAIQNKYSETIAENEVSSLNFGSEHRWLKPEVEHGLDPYHTLPHPFEGFDDEQLASFMHDADEKVSNGGTAMMVYAKMQFTEMPKEERDALNLALLKYCETDTLAMVFVWEHLKKISNVSFQ